MASRTTPPALQAAIEIPLSGSIRSSAPLVESPATTTLSQSGMGGVSAMAGNASLVSNAASVAPTASPNPSAAGGGPTLSPSMSGRALSLMAVKVANGGSLFPNTNKGGSDGQRPVSRTVRIATGIIKSAVGLTTLVAAMLLVHGGLMILSRRANHSDNHPGSWIDYSQVDGALVKFPHDRSGPTPKRLPIDDPLEKFSHFLETPSAISAQRAAMVKNEMKGAWEAYKKHAWGHDEFKPLSHRWYDWGGKGSKGTALTIVDSLSTLWLMGLKDEFIDGMNYVTDHVDWDQSIYVSVFESTIRIIGGLLSAYELSGEQYPKLLATTQRVMDKLLFAYNTSSGIPHQTVNFHDGRHWGPVWQPESAILSELGSVQLELRTLSYHTKDPKYDIRATHLTDLCESVCDENGGLCPTLFDLNAGHSINKLFSLGGNSDSYYEYLLKQYLLTGKTEERYKRLTLQALDTAIEKLLHFSATHKLAFFDTGDFLLDAGRGRTDMKMDHLTCFAGGMYGLAAETFPDHVHAPTYRAVAARITKTCNAFYEREPSGLCHDSAYFIGPQDFTPEAKVNLQRPETVESMFYQWRFTRDPKYREWAWQIFLSFVKYSKVPSGAFSGVSLKHGMPPRHDDMMQSFFMAETMKYFYLIFAEDDALDLNEWVFNTEAHPLRIRKRDPLDIWRQWEDTHSGAPAHFPPTLPAVMKSTVRTETKAMKAIRGNTVIKPPVDPLFLAKVPEDL